MLKFLILYFLISHVIGDYYLQSYSLAENKKTKFSALLYHSLLYLFIMLFVILPILSLNLFLCALAIAGMHLLIDLLKLLCFKWSEKSRKVKRYFAEKTGYIYIIDQALHILSIIIISSIYIANGNHIHIMDFIKNIFILFEINKEILIKWILVLLLIGKPANITFSMLFSHFKPIEDEIGKVGNKKAGATIGILERVIIVILLSIGQYSAIGLVLTAKSIARYNRITEDQSFGEYYLLGTFISVLYSIAVYNLIMI